jgi:hypothetical protein
VNNVYNELHDRILEQEVIYYASAIDYLVHNDPSLHESLDLAYDLWYECKDLSSEILATILYQENLRLETPWFVDELVDLF